MKLTKLKVADLKPHPRNYNRHTDSQLQELSRSLDFAGQYKNIVVSDGRILCGEGLWRTHVLKEEEYIWAFVKDGLSDRDKEKILVMDNATAAISDPSGELLRNILDDFDTYEIPGVTDDFLKQFVEGVEGIEPPEDFKSYDEDIETDHTCPKCGYQWS